MLTKFKWTPKEWTGPFQYKNEDLGEGLNNFITFRKLQRTDDLLQS